MPAIPHVVRRGAAYYWRRRIPSALAESRKSGNLILSLRTTDPRRARFLATQISALADLYLFPALMNKPLTQPQVLSIFREAFTRHLDKLEVVAVREKQDSDFDPEEGRNGERVLGWVYRLLEMRGPNISAIDERAVALMRGDGMSDRQIDEVAVTLGLLTKGGNTASDPRERLARLVRGAGGEPTPMNLALAQDAVFRARAEACFLVERRYDGRKEEIDDLIKRILAERAFVDRDREPANPSALARTPPPQAEEAPRPRIAEPSDARADAARESTCAAEPPSRGLCETGRSAGPPNPRLEDHPILAAGERLIAKSALSGWDVKTQRQARQIFALFARLMHESGVFTLAALRQRHFAALEDLLNGLPKSYGKSPRDKDRTIDELRAMGAKLPAARRGVEPGTLNRHLTFMGQLLAYIRGQGEPLDGAINLTLLRAKDRQRKRDKRSTFSADDLEGIFKLTCFTGCAGWDKDDPFLPGTFIFHRALYFATILLYYTGARREEICGLGISDVASISVKRGARAEDCHYISIQANSTRRIKNAQSARTVALHPEVLRLGFLEYVETLKRLGYKIVFPDLKSATSNAPLGDRFYDEFVKGLKLAVPDASQRKKCLHSLRKTFGNSLKQIGVTDEVRGDILGHGGANVTAEVYADPIEITKTLAIVKRLPVVTGHLQPVPIRLLPWVASQSPAPFSRPRRLVPRES